MSDEHTSIGPPPRSPAPREAGPAKVRTGMTIPGGLPPVESGMTAPHAPLPAIVVPPPMPRSSVRAKIDAVDNDAPTHVDSGEPHSFGGPSTAATSVDGAPDRLLASHDAHAQRSSVRARPVPVSSTRDASPVRRPMPAAVLFAIPAFVVAIAGSALVWGLAPRPSAVAATIVSAPPAQADPAPIDPALTWLAEVNEIDPAQVLSFVERHDRLQRLAVVPEGARIDHRLNLALDLLQAIDTPAPCPTFAAALDGIAQSGDAYFAVALRTAKVPQGSHPACAGLTERVAALRDPSPAQPPEPMPEPAIDPNDADEQRSDASAGAPGTPPRRKKTDLKNPFADHGKPVDPFSRSKPEVSDKLDEELRPFGK